jgi:2-hydroxy-3-keto-5-methylthiopentenyl-1-phosphate phosphatase
MLILCDFDNTITTEDVTNLLWDRHGIENWRDVLLPSYRAGEATTLELMDQGWRVIDRPADDLLLEARQFIRLRDGFVDFVASCREAGWPLHVISCGLDWYLHGFLPPAVPFTSYTAVRDGGWRVQLPAGYALPPGEDFKIHVMRGLQAAYPGLDTVFIGDGRNDFPIARACSRVFALAGSTLAHLCERHDLSFTSFESFDTIRGALHPRLDAPVGERSARSAIKSRGGV